MSPQVSRRCAKCFRIEQPIRLVGKRRLFYKEGCGCNKEELFVEMDVSLPHRRIRSFAMALLWIISAFGIYILSIGPVSRFESSGRASDSVHKAITNIYGPLFVAADRAGLQGWLQRYIFLWIPDKSLIIPQGNIPQQLH